MTPQIKLRKYFMIDTVNLQGTLTPRLRGTTICNPANIKTISNALGCKLMRHLPKELK